MVQVGDELTETGYSSRWLESAEPPADPALRPSLWTPPLATEPLSSLVHMSCKPHPHTLHAVWVCFFPGILERGTIQWHVPCLGAAKARLCSTPACGMQCLGPRDARLSTPVGPRSKFGIRSQVTIWLCSRHLSLDLGASIDAVVGTEVTVSFYLSRPRIWREIAQGTAHTD